MGAVAPKPTLSTHPYSKLLGFLAFSKGAVAPKPALSTHPYSKLLGFLAFSHDSSFSTLSIILCANSKLMDNLFLFD